MQRRSFLGLSGMALAAAQLPEWASAEPAPELSSFVPQSAPPAKPVTLICIGAGNRGNTYSRFAQKHPDFLKLVGVAEPIAERRASFAKDYNLSPKQQWTTWEEVLKGPKKADAVLISTPDRLHYAPAMAAIAQGYHVLLEKPVSTRLNECEEIALAAEKAGVMVAVCHVLRYAPYFVQLRQFIQEGKLGQVLNIDHFEPVGYWHMAHSFVRGNWRNEGESTFMLLAKCCHDTDMIRWLMDKRCQKVSSFGGLSHFTPTQAPAGAPKRCTDGCPVEASCPYSALKVYMDPKKQGWPVTVITSDLSEAGRLKALKEGPYGRCVYHCDNDVVDHQVVNMEFEGGATATLTMSAFSPQQGMGMRQTRIMGTHGYLEGNMRSFTYTDFRTNEQTVIDTKIGGGDAGSGHGGGDWALVEQFCKAVGENNPAYLSSTVAVSMESHKIAFQAEKARRTGTVQPV